MSERQLEESSLTRKIVNPFQKKGVKVPKKALISRNVGMMAQANTQIEHHQDTSTTGPKAVLSSSSQQPQQRTQMYFTNEPV